MQRRIIMFALFILAVAVTAVPQSQPAHSSNKILVVMPFENAADAPGIDWIGEAFPEILSRRLATPQIYVISRSDRMYAFDRLGIPANSRPSRATLYHIADEMDADYVVTGKYEFDGRTFTAHAQVMDIKRLRLTPESVESGALTQLLDVQNSLAWDLLHSLDPQLAVSKNSFLAASAPVRLDALENFVRGSIATTSTERLRYFRQAVRIDTQYAEALFWLGKTYFDSKEYTSAGQWLAKIPRTGPLANEAAFYFGLSSYYTGNFEKAEEAFTFISARLPLIEVYNNLGVVNARRGKSTSSGFFERAVTADPSDADYRFNYGLSLYRNGDAATATRQLKEAQSLRPQDGEIKSVYEMAAASLSFPTPVANGKSVRVPQERIKRNYDEASYRQLSLEIQNAREMRIASLPRSQHAAAHVDHANEILALGLTDEAESEFRESILLDPTINTGHLGLARVLLSRNDLVGARSEVLSSLQMRQTADAFIVLAHIDVQQDRLDAAQINFDRAAKLEPTNSKLPALQHAIMERSASKPSRTSSEDKP